MSSNPLRPFTIPLLSPSRKHRLEEEENGPMNKISKSMTSLSVEDSLLSTSSSTSPVSSIQFNLLPTPLNPSHPSQQLACQSDSSKAMEGVTRISNSNHSLSTPPLLWNPLVSHDLPSCKGLPLGVDVEDLMEGDFMDGVLDGSSSLPPQMVALTPRNENYVSQFDSQFPIPEFSNQFTSRERSPFMTEVSKPSSPSRSPTPFPSQPFSQSQPLPSSSSLSDSILLPPTGIENGEEGQYSLFSYPPPPPFNSKLTKSSSPLTTSPPTTIQFHPSFQNQMSNVDFIFGDGKVFPSPLSLSPSLLSHNKFNSIAIPNNHALILYKPMTLPNQVNDISSDTYFLSDSIKTDSMEVDDDAE